MAERHRKGDGGALPNVEKLEITVWEFTLLAWNNPFLSFYVELKHQMNYHRRVLLFANEQGGKTVPSKHSHACVSTIGEIQSFKFINKTISRTWKESSR